jgi:hypothetical protein
VEFRGREHKQSGRKKRHEHELITGSQHELGLLLIECQD